MKNFWRCRHLNSHSNDSRQQSRFAHLRVFKKMTKSVVACEVWFSRLNLMNANWHGRSAMSYVIRWVAMPSCSQRGSLIRSLIMERAAGEFLSSACKKTQNKITSAVESHGSISTGSNSVYLVVCCCLTATAEHQSTAIHSGQKSHLFITLDSGF